MPIYEYKCLSCSKEFEMLVRTSSPAPVCPQCSGIDLRKKLSTFAAVTATASSFGEMPAACQSCGAPGGPGACGYHQA